VKHIGLHSIAIQTNIAALASMKDMYTTILGAKEVMEMPGVVVLEMPNHFIVELYTEIADTPVYLFKNNKMVLGFWTDNIEAKFKQLKEEGHEILSPILQAGECYSYFHFTGPNEHVYMMKQSIKI